MYARANRPFWGYVYAFKLVTCGKRVCDSNLSSLAAFCVVVDGCADLVSWMSFSTMTREDQSVATKSKRRSPGEPANPESPPLQLPRWVTGYQPHLLIGDSWRWTIVSCLELRLLYTLLFFFSLSLFSSPVYLNVLLAFEQAPKDYELCSTYPTFHFKITRSSPHLYYAGSCRSFVPNFLTVNTTALSTL